MVFLQCAWYIRIICIRMALKPLFQDAVDHGVMVNEYRIIWGGSNISHYPRLIAERISARL